MLFERDIRKGVENLKLQIEIFALETTSKETKCKQNDKKTLIRQQEIVDYYILFS